MRGRSINSFQAARNVTSKRARAFFSPDASHGVVPDADAGRSAGARGGAEREGGGRERDPDG